MKMTLCGVLLFSLITVMSICRIENNKISFRWVYFAVQIMQEPGNQSALLGSTVEMFCLANASIFEWKVIHLDFRNTSSLRTLISVYYNETKQGLENVINATLISKDGIVNISYVFNISDDEMVCLMDGEFSCDLEFLDDAIQKTYVKGFLVVSGKIYH